MRGKKHTKEFLIEEIKKTTNELGRVPKAKEFKHYMSCQREFGTWGYAVESAGLEYVKQKIDYGKVEKLSKDELLDEIKGAYNKFKRTPRFYELPHYREILRQYKSLSNALKEAKIDIDHIVDSRRYSDEELLTILKSKADELGRTPTQKDIAQDSAIRVHFGTWNNALTLAGLKINRERSLSDEYLLSHLKETCKKLNRVPKAKELEHYEAISSRFGSIKKAMDLLMNRNSESITKEIQNN